MKAKAVPLTAEAFAPFGQVLEGNAEGPHRIEFMAKVFNDRDDAKLNVTWMRGKVATAPVTVKALERHPHSNQMFVPINGTKYLVAVCPSDADGNPDLSGIQVFVANGSQTVNYDAMVWHAPRETLGDPCEFIMTRWDNGSDVDTVLLTLDEPIEVLDAL